MMIGFSSVIMIGLDGLIMTLVEIQRQLNDSRQPNLYKYKQKHHRHGLIFNKTRHTIRDFSNRQHFEAKPSCQIRYLQTQKYKLDHDHHMKLRKDE